MGKKKIGKPCKAVLKPGIHYLCTCGKSDDLPLCDGAHDKLEVNAVPIDFEISSETEVYLCGCQQTKTLPFCDGSHKRHADKSS